MKKTNNFPLAFLLSTMVSCSKAEFPVHIATAFVYDITDTLRSKPDAKTVLPLYGFELNPDNAVDFRIVPVTGMKMIPSTSYRLGGANGARLFNYNDDPQYQEKNILRFSKGITKAFDEYEASFIKDGVQTTSECFNSICEQLKWLVESQAQRRYLFIYSNLFENNSTFSCFTVKGQNLLKKSPEKVWEKLKSKNHVPDNLEGIDIVFIYKPDSEEQEAMFLSFYGMYKSAFEKVGAKVSFCITDSQIKEQYETL